MDVVNEDKELKYFVNKEIPEDLSKFGKTVVNGLNIKNRFFHIEFFRTPDGKLVILEVNLRIPGFPTSEMWNFSHERDIFKDYSDMISNNSNGHDLHPIFGPKKYCAFTARKTNRYQYCHSHQDITTYFGEQFVHVIDMPSVFRAVMGDIAYLYVTDDIIQLNIIHNFISQKQ